MINREGTKKIIKIAGVTFVVLIVLGYALVTSHSFISGPEIVIYEPVNGSALATSSVMIKGAALRIQDITLNGRPILIDEKGNFNETLLLSPGYNVSLFSAKDKFDRTTEYKLELVYKDK
jgi:hypothetical protein